MSFKVRKTYKILAAVSVILVGLLITLRFTSLCKLQAVSISPEKYAKHSKDFNKALGQNLFKVAAEEIAESLLDNDKIMRIDLNYKLFNNIDIIINDTRPILLILAPNGRTIYKLDKNYWLMPFENKMQNFDFPIITGVKKCRPYARIKDCRLIVLAEKLKMIKEDFTDFYLAISSIDISEPDYISVFIDGLPFRLETHAGDLYKNFKNLRVFMLDYNPDMSDVRKLDFRLGKMIIATS